MRFDNEGRGGFNRREIMNAHSSVRVVLALFVLLASPLRSEEPRTLRIAVHEKPPYAMRDPGGEWRGIGISLWKAIANKLSLQLEFIPTPYPDIIPAVARGDVDAAVGELEISPESARVVRFTQAYMISSVGVATGSTGWGVNWGQILSEVFNASLLQAILGILAGMVIVSLIIWLLERKHQTGHFRGRATGFGSALWFAAVTMTGVGYGDKTPVTIAGRVVAFLWMLAGLLLVAGFTAAVASSAASARVASSLSSASDLKRLHCGVVVGSLSDKLLTDAGLVPQKFGSISDVMQALREKKIQAAVGDSLSLRYIAQNALSDTPPFRYSISSLRLKEVFIGIPVRANLDLYDSINLQLLDVTASQDWQRILNNWLGPSEGRL